MNLDAIIKQQNTILDKARDLQSKDDFSPADQARFDSLMSEADRLAKQASNYRRLNGLSDPGDYLAVANQAGSSHISIVSQPSVYKNLGEQLMDVMEMTVDGTGAPRARERYTMVVNATGGSTGVPSEGGYLVERDKAADIASTSIEAGVFSSRCSQQPISANADSFSYLAAKDRNRTTRSGLTVYRKGEADLMVDSGKVNLAERELRLEDLYGLVFVTNRMLRDAPAMSEFIKRELRKELSFRLDQEIWSGNGAGQCLGIVNSGLPVSVAKENNQTADTIVAENVVKMLGRFRGNLSKAAWFINQDALQQLPLMKIGDSPVYAVDYKGHPFGTLLGIPVVPCEFSQTVGDKWDILLGDFSEYLLIRKGGLEEVESIHVRFLYDESAFRFMMRCNGQPMHDQPITPLNGSNTLSPFVTLDAR